MEKRKPSLKELIEGVKQVERDKKRREKIKKSRVWK